MNIGEVCYVYRATVVRVIDADTLVLNIDLGFRVHTEIEGRINGIDAPEMSTPEGIAAREAVVNLLTLAKTVTVSSYRDKRSFARWVVDVWVDDLLLAGWLSEHHFVKAIPRFEHIQNDVHGRWYAE